MHEVRFHSVHDPDPNAGYWLTRPLAERVGAVEQIRQATWGWYRDLPSGFQRVLEHVRLAPRALPRRRRARARRARKTEFTTADRMTHLGTPPLRIDIMTSISGVRFREAWSQRVQVDIEGMRIAFVGRADFVKNKRASARAKDIADLALLEEAIPKPKSRPRRTRQQKRPQRRKG